MAKKLYDVVATIREEGKDKPRYINLGSVIETDKGLCMKMESVPVGWNGWANFYEPKPKADKPKQSNEDIESDIPF